MFYFQVFSATSSVPTASITPQDVKTDVSREAEYSSADTHKVLKVSTERGMIIV
jgi:hypothetical protein